ncbi:unnamed protein product [Thelazia callipaeda]|uniref:RGS domain-containing protein n=1 Tax=Thelazia callipaeda TaxID=103827 RepID=A0A0N5CXC1_THECL|nr:unnamed protein product [Thelazia callipaeda]
MLKVVERESLIASEGEDDNLVERPLCSVPGALQQNSNNGNEWTEAFDELIRSPEGRRQFTKFLRSEYSEENIVFWWAVEELHEIGRNGGELVNAVQDIYNTFVAADSSLAINIDHDTRADITERIEHQDKANYTEDVFDKAQSHVYRYN